MNREFRGQLCAREKFAITLELVPGPESRGRSVDTVKAIAEDARKDGRVSAVSITDNPGGNPALSPDVLGSEIQDAGMDVIVHCTCRDQNRAGLESRALQLAHMGLLNILALTGDYSSGGFGGQGLPVFDLDSVTLICLLHALNGRVQDDTDSGTDGPHAGFFVGCAVSPFKRTEAECLAQYAKLRMKTAVGADFVITQLGYDARKFQELRQVQRLLNIELPTLGTVFLLTPKVAKILHRGNVPGAVVTRTLLSRVTEGGNGGASGSTPGIEAAARLAVVLKGLGYAGVHLSGVRRSFKAVDQILSRMDEIEGRWREFLPEFDLPQSEGFYVFEESEDQRPLSTNALRPRTSRSGFFEKAVMRAMQGLHRLFFRLDSPMAPALKQMAALLNRSCAGRLLLRGVEDPMKMLLLRCRRCGDCAIQHTAFLCPESQCPKHMRNGACGGSTDGQCEVDAKRRCVWARCYDRLSAVGQADTMGTDCVPPRMWQLDGSSAWLNFHLRRDHQSLPCDLARLFQPSRCPVRKGASEPAEESAK